jgi:hypothetical protein
MFLFRWFRRTLYVIVAIVFAYLVVTSVQIVTASRAPSAVAAVRPAAAIVVIGTPAGRSGTSADVRARCSQAATLFHGGRSHHLVTTGGRPAPGDPVEAAVLAKCLIANAVPKRDIDELPVSTVTGQLQSVAQLYPRSSGASVIVVADPLETKWLLSVASSSGLRAVASPALAPKRSFLSTIGYIWNQSLAVGFGRIFGYDHTGWVSG